MKNPSVSYPSSTNINCWRDEMYDYFRTSDGKVVRVRRDFEREAAEAEAERSRKRVMLWNWTVRCVVTSFLTVNVVLLVVLIVLDIKIGGV